MYSNFYIFAKKNIVSSLIIKESLPRRTFDSKESRKVKSKKIAVTQKLPKLELLRNEVEYSDTKHKGATKDQKIVGTQNLPLFAST